MPRPCPIKATLSMWCELINIIDATKADRQWDMLKGKSSRTGLALLEVIE